MISVLFIRRKGLMMLCKEKKIWLSRALIIKWKDWRSDCKEDGSFFEFYPTSIAIGDTPPGNRDVSLLVLVFHPALPQVHPLSKLSNVSWFENKPVSLILSARIDLDTTFESGIPFFFTRIHHAHTRNVGSLSLHFSSLEPGKTIRPLLCVRLFEEYWYVNNCFMRHKLENYWQVFLILSY